MLSSRQQSWQMLEKRYDKSNDFIKIKYFPFAMKIVMNCYFRKMSYKTNQILLLGNVFRSIVIRWMAFTTQIECKAKLLASVVFY